MVLAMAMACRPQPQEVGEGTEAPSVGEETAAPEEPALEVKNPGTFISASIGEPESLDPAYTYETGGAAIEANIYDSMLYFDRSKADEFVPALATEWELSDDQLTYTFTIREGVTFHEGGTLEPSDIAYSIQRGMLQDRVDGPQWLLLDPILGTSSILDYVADLAGVEVTDKTTMKDLPEDTRKSACEDVMAAVSGDDAEGTVTVTLKLASPWFLQLMAQPWGAALDKEWMMEQGDWDGTCDAWWNWHDPEAKKSVLFNAANGTGPYKFVKWTPGEEIELVRNDDYWRTEPVWEGGPSGPARIERVLLKVVEEWGPRFTMLQQGDADTVAVPRSNISQVEPLIHTEYEGEDESAPSTVLNPEGRLKLFKGYTVPAATAAMFNWQITAEGGNPFIGSGKLDGAGIPPDFFSDVHVRKAFNYCFDWEAYIRDAIQGEGIQSKGPIIQGLQGYREDQATYSHDAEKCAEEFKAAFDGKLWDTGFRMSIGYNTGNESRRIVAEILQNNILDVHPDGKFLIDVVALPWPRFLETRRAGQLPIAISGWLEDYHDPSNWVHPFMHGSGAYARAQNFDPELQAQFTELIDGAAHEPDEAKRTEAYEELQNLAYENAISIFLEQATGRAYFQKWISGYIHNPLTPGLWYYALSKGE
jgi:peptide/nickel transport system substrate-binding protein